MLIMANRIKQGKPTEPFIPDHDSEALDHKI
jgi:hypothetical protein